MVYASLFILGLIFGSFFNVLIWRLPREMGFVFDRSKCPKCSKALGLKDLIPIISYVLCMGRCRYCGKKIALRYPVVELLSAIIFLGLFIIYGMCLKYILSLIVFCSLLVIFFSDVETKIIPNEMVITLIIAGILSLVESRAYLNAMWGFIFGGGSLLIIGFLGEKIYKKEAMGGGDIKLAAALGLILGLNNTILMLFLSFIIGSILAIFVMISFKKGIKDYIPFGPAIVISASITYFFSDLIISWYLGYL